MLKTIRGPQYEGSGNKGITFHFEIARQLVTPYPQRSDVPTLETSLWKLLCIMGDFI